MDPNLLIERNKEMFDLVDLIALKTQRLIQVYGKKITGQKLGMKLVVIKAVRYFLERHYYDFIDGVFFVDLKDATS